MGKCASVFLRYLNHQISKQVENFILFSSIKMFFKTNTRSFAWCHNNAEIQEEHKRQDIILMFVFIA